MILVNIYSGDGSEVVVASCESDAFTCEGVTLTWRQLQIFGALHAHVAAAFAQA